MNAYIIYKSIIDQESGNTTSIELIEVDKDENMAVRFTKLYNNGVPWDLRGKVAYSYIGVRVN